MIYRIAKIPHGKPKVVHQNRLTLFEGDHDEEEEVNLLNETPDFAFDEFMGAYGATGKARYGVTTEEQRDLFSLPEDYSLAHGFSANLHDDRGLATVFRRKFGRLPELRDQLPVPGKTLQFPDGFRSIFYLITKNKFQDRATYQHVWEALHSLREQALESDVKKIAMPKIESHSMNWRIIRSMLETIFKDTDIQVMVCSYPHDPQPTTKTIQCYFHTTGRCNRGSSCRFSHSIPVQ